VASSAVVDVIAFLTQSKLVRINRTTDELEPWLAESWTMTSDEDPENAGPAYRLKLREGVTFSDGAPFTAADVEFAFEAVYDPRNASPIGDALRVAGAPLSVRALGDHEVEIAFPAPYGPGLRLLDNLSILPRHKLGSAQREGQLASAWSPSTPVSEIAGLGPFVISEYRPAERLVFARNPRYWRRDPQGRSLPYLDRLTLEIVPDQNAELLRLESGQLDFTLSEIRPEDYRPLKLAQDEGRLRLLDLGIGLDADAFWFNLTPAISRPPSADSKPWLRRAEFRHALSLAVDRQAYCDTVFFGAAEPVHGPITPGNAAWHWPELPGGEHDPTRAKALLASLGLADRNGDGMREDSSGRPVRFTVLVQSGIAAVERGASFIRDELARIGVGLDVVRLESGAMFVQLQKGEYDAIFHRLLFSGTDPAVSLDFWRSSGSLHLWNPSQPKPATEWEKQIDELMRQQIATRDHDKRVFLFREVQQVFNEHLPAIYFAAPRIYLATSARLANATPARLRPQLLWNADTLAVNRSGR
jgi:peptide/nickel transport system substrate-binding protein